MTFQWKKDNKDIVNTNASDISSMTEGKNTESVSVLTIYKVQQSDAGKYQCVVSNSFGSTYSVKTSISVLSMFVLISYF